VAATEAAATTVAAAVAATVRQPRRLAPAASLAAPGPQVTRIEWHMRVGSLFIALWTALTCLIDHCHHAMLVCGRKRFGMRANLITFLHACLKLCSAHCLTLACARSNQDPAVLQACLDAAAQCAFRCTSNADSHLQLLQHPGICQQVLNSCRVPNCQ
jgi:hypothetical protein